MNTSEAPSGRGRRVTPRLLFARLALALVPLAVLAVLFELAAGAIIRRRMGVRPWSREALATERARLETARADTEVEHRTQPTLVVHPFLGYICNFDRTHDYRGAPNRRSGFYSEVEATYRPEGDGEFVVVVLGGSVAAQLCITGGEHLRRKIAEIPEVRGRKVVLNALCQGGYKQPQQLLAIAYHLALGAHADIVINLDGANELLFFQQNAFKYGIDPAYPWNWLAVAPSTERDPVVMRAHLKIMRERERRGRGAAQLRASGRYRSAGVRLVSYILDRASEQRERFAEHEIAQRLAEMGECGREFFLQGPVYADVRTTDEALAETAELWCRANIALSDLMRARGTPYVHFLQPNQYFPGTRNLTDWERRHACDVDSIYHEPLSKGYAFLTNKIETLRAHKVPFVDLTMRFKDVPETIYEDTFTHFNKTGNRLLGDAVAGAIAEALARRPE